MYDLIVGLTLPLGFLMLLSALIMPKQYIEIESDGTTTYKPNTYKMPLLIVAPILIGIGCIAWWLDSRQQAQTRKLQSITTISRYTTNTTSEANKQYKSSE